MKLKKLEWRNIGPFGNKLQTIEFSDEGGLWMILGRNGNGKSFLVNLPKILYYGKLERFKKDEIANRLNKHGWIKGLIETKPNVQVSIERNFSPSELRVHKFEPDDIPDDSNDIGKAGIVNYQEYIDVEVTGLPYHIFSNIISLSVNDFKSFISMTPHDKRIIIDKLFAMEVINKMYELIKKDLRDIKTNMDLFDREIQSIKANIDNAVKELKSLEERVTEDNSKKILELSKLLEAYKPKLKDAYDKLNQYNAKKNEISKAYNIFLQQKTKIKHEIEHLKNQIDLFNQEKCPTCTTPFNDTRFDLIKGALHESITQKQKEFEEVVSSESQYTSLKKQVNEGIEKINTFIIQVQSTYRTIENELKKLKIDTPKEFGSIQNIISDNSIKLKDRENDKVTYDDDYKYLAMLEQLYSDAGVKKKILESYLPTLNREISYTLNELHFPYSLLFNSDFEPELHHLGVDVSVDTLSTGEKKRVDLAVLVSIIRMIKRKYPGLNIFMLDEVLSSIDGDGIYDIIGLLQKIAKEMNMNIFVIHQTPLPIEHFDYIIEISKNAGFSDLSIQKLN
jgi:DNA repair exonuclease SbcCD ATPase subunit